MKRNQVESDVKRKYEEYVFEYNKNFSIEDLKKEYIKIQEKKASMEGEAEYIKLEIENPDILRGSTLILSTLFWMILSIITNNKTILNICTILNLNVIILSIIYIVKYRIVNKKEKKVLDILFDSLELDIKMMAIETILCNSQ